MHRPETVRRVLELADQGASTAAIVAETQLPRSTVRDWLAGRRQGDLDVESCSRCGRPHLNAEETPSYAYLLGLYLGDGCLSRHARGVYRLRIVLDTAYPGIIGEAVAAISAVRGRPGHVMPRETACVDVSSYWRAWPCLFPQHGAGKKHHRTIELCDWQKPVLERWPGQLLRGLIHSDGCRFQNTGRNWSAPRYSFSNRSGGIRSIFCTACERLALRWTKSGEYTIYVSRQADVAVLDRFVGPKL